MGNIGPNTLQTEKLAFASAAYKLTNRGITIKKHTKPGKSKNKEIRDAVEKKLRERLVDTPEARKWFDDHIEIIGIGDES